MRAVLKLSLVVLLLGALPSVGRPSPRPGVAVEAEDDPTAIPESARGLKNPLAASTDTLRAGRALWRAHCESCHGTAGRGDGPNARLHELRKGHAPRDLTDPKVQQNLSDGELFWRISKGIIEDGDNIIMPSYERKLPIESQRWELVLLVRELGSAALSAAQKE